MASQWHQLSTGEDEEEEAEEEELRGEDQREEEEHRIDINDHDDDYDSFWDSDHKEEEEKEEAKEEDGNDQKSRFLPPLAAEDHSIIDVLAEELRHQQIPSYLDQFDVIVPDAELVIGAVPLKDLQQREREIEQAQLRRKQVELDLFRHRELRLTQREVQIKDELRLETLKQHEQIVQHKRQAAKIMEFRTKQLSHVFGKAESHLKSVLKSQQARVKEVFGSLDHSQMPDKRKQYRVEWTQIPVTLQIRVKALRALKDKLPSGQYVLLVTLYDRLGGHALHWTAWDPEEEDKPRSTRHHHHHRRKQPGQVAEPPSLVAIDRPSVTRPFAHKGRFFHTDVAVHQNVFVVCPPECNLRPGNVLIFELFALAPGGSNSTTTARRRLSSSSPFHQDQIVAWGAMPLATPEFTHVDGKYKIPLLRGEMDATMDKYKDVEAMYSGDLSAWLCNLYFQVTPLKKEMEKWIFRGQQDQQERAYDVEIDPRNGVYRLGGHERLATSSKQEDTEDEQLRIRKKSCGAAATGETRSNIERSRATTLLTDDGGENDSGSGGQGTRRRPGGWLALTKKQKSNRVYAGSVVTPQQEEGEQQDETHKYKYDGEDHHPAKPKMDPSTMSSSDSRRNLRPRSPCRHFDDDAHQPTTACDDEDDDNDELSGHVLDTENYRFSVNPLFARESAHHARFQTSRKLHYLRHELFVDMGLSRHQLHKMEFWLLLLVLCFALWLRVYVHYVTQYLFLKFSRVPVFYFKPQWTTCMIKYTWRTVATHTEIGVVVLGALGNWLFFSSLAIAAAVSQAFVGELPAFGSKVLVCMGLATVLDPFLVLVVDVLNHQYDCAARSDCLATAGVSLLSSQACKCVEGDAFKLYTRFLALEGSGLVGVVVTGVIYVAQTCLSLVTVYMYLLHVHMNGRMLDVYRRIHAQESDLFLPHDCEVALQELQAICEQATRWKGPRGSQRKVFVHEYLLQDPLDLQFQEKSTHIALYTVTLDEQTGVTTRELYRHFLKAQDGAIIELFGEVGTGQNGGWQQLDLGGKGGHGGASGVVASSMALLASILQDGQAPQTMTIDATAAHLSTLF